MVKHRLGHYMGYCLLLFSSICTKAQYVLQGRVINMHREPVVNATIKLKDSAKGLPRLFAISNALGQYKIKVPANNHSRWLECSLLGYLDNSLLLPSPQDATLQQNIVLLDDTAVLPEINVYSIPTVTISGDTTSFRVDAFKKGNELNVSDLLNVIPGFSVNNGRISYNGRSVTKVLVEDDDLFGNDYNTITQNLSPRGIEKIQLIENYNDKTYLSNRLKKGDELVLNLKFNRKYLYHLIASNEAGLSFSPVADFFKIRQNLVSLIPRIKSVTTANFNNTGLLASEILGTAFNIPELSKYRKDAINFDLAPRFYAGGGMQIPDIASPVIPKNRMINNYTSVITNNTLYKVSKKWQLKSIFQYYRDAFHQQQDKITDYTVSGSNLKVFSSQFLQKQLPVFNAATEAVYAPSAYTQLVYKAGYLTQSENDSLYDDRQSLATYTSNHSTSRRFQQQLGFSFAIDSSHIIDIRGFQNIESSLQLPLLYPAYLYAAFTNDTTSEQLGSSIQSKINEYTFQVKITGQQRKTNWSVEIWHTLSHAAFNSEASLYKAGAATSLSDPLLLNKNSLDSRISGAIFAYNTPLSHILYLRTNQQVETGQLRLHDGSLPATQFYTHYLPSVNLNFSYNKTNTLNFGMDVKNKLPQLYNLSNGYVFYTGNTILQGNSNLQPGVSHSASISYSYSEMVRHKLLFLSRIAFSSDPVLYITHTMPSIYYTQNDLMPSNKKMTVLTLVAMADKYIPAFKSQLRLEFQQNRFHTFYNINNQAGNIDLTGTTIGSRIKTLLTGELIASYYFKATFNTQFFDKGFAIQRKNNSRTFTHTAELVYHLNKKWTFNTKYQYVRQRISMQAYNIHLGDVSVKYQAIRDRLSLMLSGNNLLNNGHFSTVNFTSYSINTQDIYLLCPYWMLHVTLEF